eukprot:12887275-Prorocentrum_lima.AAC.1
MDAPDRTDVNALYNALTLTALAGPVAVELSSRSNGGVNKVILPFLQGVKGLPDLGEPMIGAVCCAV